jgi:hypothetical protein
MLGKGRLDPVERLGQLAEQPLPRPVSRARPFSRTNRAAPSRSSNNLHLIGNRRLGHPQLIRRGREIF